MPSSPPLKNTISRFQAAHGKEPRASLSAAESSSKPEVASNKTSVKATSTRTVSPYLDRHAGAASAASLRSGTPYSQMSNSSGSRILAATSWSEVTEDDLVSNLGSRERTRQEVLFEIISSEERYTSSDLSPLLFKLIISSRYVQELIKMKDTFIDPLLHPFSFNSTSNSPLSSTPNLDYDYYRAESPTESGDHLPPIAARFMSPTPSSNTPPTRTKETPIMDGESDDDYDGEDPPPRTYISRKSGTASPTSILDHPRSPYHSKTNGRSYGVSVPFPSRSHMSLPPPPRAHMSASTHSLGRQSTILERERERKISQGDSSPKSGVLRKFRKSQTTPAAIFGDSLAPHQLPEDLRICLEVVDSGVLDGHKRLSEALKKRYDDQFPLVRSLADVFVSNVSLSPSSATLDLTFSSADLSLIYSMAMPPTSSI